MKFIIKYVWVCAYWWIDVSGGHRWDYDDYDAEKNKESRLDFPCKYNMHTYIYL